MPRLAVRLRGEEVVVSATNSAASRNVRALELGVEQLGVCRGLRYLSTACRLCLGGARPRWEVDKRIEICHLRLCVCRRALFSAGNLPTAREQKRDQEGGHYRESRAFHTKLLLMRCLLQHPFLDGRTLCAPCALTVLLFSFQNVNLAIPLPQQGLSHNAA